MAAGGGAALSGLGLYGWRVEPHWVEFVRRPLPIRNLPLSLAGRTLVQVSDLHLGPRVDKDYLVQMFGQISALMPDIVVITGDLISHHHGIFADFPGVYGRFPRGRLATLATLGNHDYGAGWRVPAVAQQVADLAAAVGITVLRNQTYDVEGLQIVGLDDLWARRFAPSDPLAALDRTRAALALSHNPDTVDLPVWQGYEGWILSGHTHGGQCRPPFLPPPILPVRNKRYTAGEFALNGNRRLYINRGLGHLLHVRFNVRPEVTVFTLERA